MGVHLVLLGSIYERARLRRRLTAEEKLVNALTRMRREGSWARWNCSVQVVIYREECANDYTGPTQTSRLPDVHATYEKGARRRSASSSAQLVLVLH